MKLCKHCRKTKPIEDFHKHPDWSDGRYSTCADCRNGQKKAQDRKYRELHPEIFRAAIFKSKYGITIEDFEQTKIEQGNLCAICRQEFDRACQDHDHETNTPRGVLCDK